MEHLFLNPFDQSDVINSRKSSTVSSSSTSGYIRPDAFPGHRDTLARLQRTRDSDEDIEQLLGLDIHKGAIVRPSVTFRPGSTLTVWGTYTDVTSEQLSRAYTPGAVVDHLLELLSHQDYLNLRLTCRQWYRALPHPSLPGSYRVPREVLQTIFSYLAPCDFDAARHTCRKWFDAGLDTQLLRSMLRMAQCQNAFKADLRRLRSYHDRDVDDAGMSDEWLMSKRVATATRLSIDWRGLWSQTSIDLGHTRFNLIEQVNFRRLFVGPSSSESQETGKTFTVSTCGGYLLVCFARDIFVYNMKGSSDTLLPIVRLAAKHNVLRVSMDTSSGRYAVAALLDDHTGVLWDLNYGRVVDQPHLCAGEPMSLGMKAEVRGTSLTDQTRSLTGHLPLRRDQYNSWSPFRPFNFNPEDGQAVPGSNDCQTAHEGLTPILDEPESFCSSPQSEEQQAGPSTGITIQTRPTATYHNLGSPDDAPRSVAICPTRKCVAYGCRLGIELHWVDALTGGDLNRWFPLAAPSDHLYFLPQREGLDSGKKLRLISSAAGPSAPSTSRSGSLPARLKQRQKSHDRGRRQSMTRLFFGSLPFPSAAVFPSSWTSNNVSSDEDRRGILRTVDCDHYHAVPLSDGHHMLYTDPVNGLLSLGSDAPLSGPTKLVRKAVFIPPTVENDEWAGLMSCYRAGHQLQWGVRIVAAHRDGRLILYNVPADLFVVIQALRGSIDTWDEGAGVLAQSDLLMDDVLSAHPYRSTDPEPGNTAASILESETPLRTVQIQGVEIGHVGRDIVDDIAVDTSNGGLRVWAFCRSGLARLLNLYINLDHEVRQRFVGSDGLLRDALQSSVQNDDEGRRSPKGKERAHSKDDDHVIPRRLMDFDGTSEARDETQQSPAPDQISKTSIVARRSLDLESSPSQQTEALQLEILTSAVPQIHPDGESSFEIEILTDWRGECLFAPYVVVLN